MKNFLSKKDTKDILNLIDLDNIKAEETTERISDAKEVTYHYEMHSIFKYKIKD